MQPDPTPPAERDAATEHLARADAALAAGAAARGRARAAHLHDAARAFFAAGEDDRGRSTLRDAYDAWPADDGAFVEALRDAVADVDRLADVLQARARAVPWEASACDGARADALLAFGRFEAAAEVYRSCLAARPQDAGAIAGLREALAGARREDERRHRAAAEAAR